MGLRAGIDALYDHVELQTAKAQDALIRYRNLKHESEQALCEAGDDYHDALQAFRRADALTAKLVELRVEHRKLTRVLSSGAGPELDGMGEERQRLRELGEELSRMKDEMRALRVEAMTEKNVERTAARR